MASVSRRRFLEDSLLAAATVAAVGPVRSAVAADQSASANEKLGVAVVGVGGRGADHLSAYAGRKDTPVLYVCDPDEKFGLARVAQVTKKQGFAPKWVRDFREALDDKNVNIVSTATPNHWHALVAIWAMQAGKDVYVEKPVSHNVSEGRRAVETARKYKRICQAGTQCRSMEGSIQAIDYVKSGKIGEVKLSRGLCYKTRNSIGPRGTYEIPAEVDYNLWSGPAPMVPLTRPRFHYDWHWQWLWGNGDLGNQGIHQMDIARWGLGVDTLSSRVLSYGGRLGYEDAGETANTQVILHEFDCGKTLVFEVRGLKTDPLLEAKVGVIFYGTKGYVVLTSYTKGAAFAPDGTLLEKFEGKGDHYDNFIAACRSRKVEDLRGDILEGHLSSALCHTGNISYRLGQPASAADVKSCLAKFKTNDDAVATFERVTAHLADNGVSLDSSKICLGPEIAFDPKTETFPGNADANAQLTREYRKPFVVPAAGQV